MIVNKYSNGGGGGSYTLPVASQSTLGGVKVGSGLTIDGAGVLSVSGGSATYYNVSDINDMEYSERRAWFVEVVEKVQAGEQIFMQGISRDTVVTGITITMPLVRFKEGTYQEGYGYQQGWVFFSSNEGASNEGESARYYYFNMSSAGNLSGIDNQGKLSPQNTYNLKTATSSRLGGVKVGSGLSIENGVLSVSGGSGEQVYVINDIIEDSAATAEFYTLMRNAISGSTAEGWGFKVFYRYRFFDLNDTMCPLQNAWISDYNAFGNENVKLVFETNGYAFDYGNQINDYILVDIASDGSAAVDNHSGRVMPSNYQRIINVTSAGTFVNPDELAVFSEENYMHKVIFKWVEENDGVEWGQAPLKYVYRQYETVDDTPHLIYYFCAEVPVNGSLMVGHWHADENNWHGYTLDSWAAPYIQP